MRYSALAILANALGGNRNWPPVWREPAPKPAYDVVVIGGGGHGLATAWYLAKNHGITNVAVLERGYLGGGNVGRNTTHRAGQLSAQGQRRVLFAFAEALGGAGAGAQLQRDDVAARDPEPLPLGRAVRRLRPARQRDADAGRRRGAAGPGGGSGRLAVPQLRRSAVSDPGRVVAAAGGDGAARRGGLGFRAGRGRAGGRPHPELRGDGVPNRGRPGPGRGDDAGIYPRRRRWDGGRRTVEPGGGDGGAAAADREPCAAGLRDRGAEAGDHRGW